MKREERREEDVDAGGKPSTWFPPEGLVEQSALARERKQKQKREQKRKGTDTSRRTNKGENRSGSKSINTTMSTNQSKSMSRNASNYPSFGILNVSISIPFKF